MEKYVKPEMDVIELDDTNVLTASCTGVDNVVVGCSGDTGCAFDSGGGCSLVLCGTDCSTNTAPPR